MGGLGGFRRERRRDRVWEEADNILSNLSFVEILAMITSYRNKAYLLICEKFQKDKHCRLAVGQVSIIPLI